MASPLRRKTFLIFALVFSLLAALAAIIAGEWMQKTADTGQLVEYLVLSLAIIGCILLVLAGYVWDNALHRRLQALNEEALVRDREEGLAGEANAGDADEVVTLARRIEHMAQSIQRAEDSYRGIVEDLTDLVCRYRPDGRLTFVNGAYARFRGRPRAELLGSPFPPFADDLVPGAGERADADVVSFEQALDDPEGHRRWIAWTVRTIMSPGGEILEFQAVGHDITTRKEAENALREAKEAAEAADRIKTEFLAIIRHEIQTPINGVIGFSRLLLETPLTREQKDFVDMVRSCGGSLEALVNDILDLSQIEAGQLSLRPAPFALQRCLEEAMALFAEQARAAGLALDLEIAPDVPGIVTGDQHRLGQIVSNLVGNAVKFTKQGGVTLRVSCEKGDTIDQSNRRRITLHFSVRDTGVGIAGDKLALLFRPFSQVDTSARRLHGGAGLGLAIAKRLCELMGGTIGVESYPGTGSTFRFSARMEYERGDSTSPMVAVPLPHPAPAH